MTESESGVETGISRRKAIKLGALGAAGGAAAWLLPGTAGAARRLAPPGICARGSGDACGRPTRQCGTSKGADSFGALCVCAADSRTPATHCVEDRPDLEIIKCVDRLDCEPGQLCVKRCIEEEGLGLNVSICAWPCSKGPVIEDGEDE